MAIDHKRFAVATVVALVALLATFWLVPNRLFAFCTAALWGTAGYGYLSHREVWGWRGPASRFGWRGAVSALPAVATLAALALGRDAPGLTDDQWFAVGIFAFGVAIAGVTAGIGMTTEYARDHADGGAGR